MAFKKDPLKNLRKVIDKHIDELNDNSKEIIKTLELLKDVDIDKATNKEKAELKELEDTLANLDLVLDKIIGK